MSVQDTRDLKPCDQHDDRPPPSRRVARARARAAESAAEREKQALARAQRLYELLGGDDDEDDW